MKENFRIPEVFCPYCQSVCREATNVLSDNEPEPGDLGLCFNCGEFLVIGNDLLLRVLTEPEKTQVKSFRKAQEIQQSLREYKEHKS